MTCPRDFQEVATIREATKVSDNAGGYTKSWADRVTIFCMIEETAGAESIIGGRLEHTTSLVLTTHYDSTILPTDSALVDGTEYKITRVENVDRKDEYMRIYCETGRI